MAVTEALLHRSVEARNVRSEGMRDREACSQASSNAEKRREQSSQISRQWRSRAPEAGSVAVTQKVGVAKRAADLEVEGARDTG